MTRWPFSPGAVLSERLRGRTSTVAIVAATAVLVGLIYGPAAPHLTGPGSSSSASGPALVPGSAAEAKNVARRTHQPVEIVSRETASTTTYANPDGTQTLVEYAGPIRAKVNGRWVPLNPKLVHRKLSSLKLTKAAQPTKTPKPKSGGRGASYPGPATAGEFIGPVPAAAAATDEGYSPEASTNPVTISPGGPGSADVPLAQVDAADSAALAVFWSGDLPAANVDGAQATYPLSKAEGVTVTALASGFESNVVLNSQPATTPVYNLPIATSGVTLKPTTAGGYRADDAKGNEVFDIPQVLMWDSTRGPDPDAGPTKVPVDSSLVTVNGQLMLQIRPAAAFLASAKYPVQIDPVVIANQTRLGDTWVSEASPTSNFAYDANLDFGYKTKRNRTYIQFQDMTQVSRQIISATLRLYEWDSASCTSSGVYAAPASSYWTTTGMTWSGTNPGVDQQPTINTTYGSSTSFATGWNGGNCPNNFETIDVTKMVTAWENQTIPNYGIAVRAATESDTNGYKAFCSMNLDTPANNSVCNTNYGDSSGASHQPTLSITYNTPPGQAQQQATEPVGSPQGSCTTGSSRPYINSTTPVLKAEAVDLDNDPDRIDFQVWNVGGSSPISSGNSTFGPPSALEPWRVPASALADGGVYQWRAQGDDGYAQSSIWSSWCEFGVDTTPPAAPAIASSSFPANAWTGTSGPSGTFTLTPGADGGTNPSGVVAVKYALDDPTISDSTTTVTAGTAATTGTAVTTSSITIPLDGPHILYAETLDKAGNASAVATYVFNTGYGALTSPREGDRSPGPFYLTPIAKDATSVQYQYRRGPTDTWANAGAPVTLANGTAAPFLWDATAALGGAGALQLRVLLAGGTGNGAGSAPVDVTVDREATSSPSQPMGPGSVDLLTGEETISSIDTSYFGISVARTFRSLNPTAGAQVTGLAAPFGPSWATGGSAGFAGTAYTALQQTSSTAVQLVKNDGTKVQFTNSGQTLNGSAIWTPEHGSENLQLLSAASVFTLTQTDGTVTAFNSDPTITGLWKPVSSSPTGSGNSTSEGYLPAESGTGQELSRIVAPNANVSNQSSCLATTKPLPTPPLGCRVIQLNYSPSSTTPPASGSVGAYPGRVTSLSLFMPDASNSTETTTSVAQYDYDSNGNLADAWDPRISPALKTSYGYDTAGRVVSVTPPGDRPWTIGYDTSGSIGTGNNGKILAMARDSLDSSHPTNVWNVVYNVPLTTGASGPYDMAAANVATWAQTDVPATATAIFPPDQVPGGNYGAQGPWNRATIHYLDTNGREVDTATPGGGISTINYDQFGNVSFTLTAVNRGRALASNTDPTLIALGLAGQTPSQRAQQLSTVSVYDGTGQRVLETYAPLHQVVLASGKTALARTHTVTTYDEGRPSDGSAQVTNMPTTAAEGARVVGSTSDSDVRTTRTTYDWTLGLALTKVQDFGSLNITAVTRFDSRGRVVHADMPTAYAGNRTNGADSTDTHYWNEASGPCVGHPEWDGMVCQTAPSGAITGGGSNPNQRATTTTTYTPLLQTATVATSANGVTRTITAAYDSASRLDTRTTTGGLGTAVPIVKTIYDTNSGRVIETREINSSGGTVRSVFVSYDTLGRQTSYTDADGGNTQTSWNYMDEKTASNQYSNGSTPLTTTYGYDADRHSLNSIVDPVAGTFAVRAFDLANSVVDEALPGSVEMTQSDDPTGVWVNRTYTGPAGVLLQEKVVPNSHAEWGARTRGDATAPGSSQAYAYDGIGRLTTASDKGLNSQGSPTCTTRAYGFDPNSNRTSLATNVDTTVDSKGNLNCSISGATTVSSSYDTADRIQNGATYDAHGRNLTASEATQTSAGPRAVSATLAYFTNDQIQRETVIDPVTSTTQGRQTWTMDPAARLDSWTTETSTNSGSTWAQTGAKTNHYDDNTDAPRWIADTSGGNIARNITDASGNVAATSSAVGAIHLLLGTLHRDIGQDISLSTPTQINTSASPVIYDTDEFGNSKTFASPARYLWEGSARRSSETPYGSIILMGARPYNPASGRFLSTDAVPGGGANAYDYAGQDPVNNSDLLGNWYVDKECHLWGQICKWTVYLNKWDTRILAAAASTEAAAARMILNAFNAAGVAGKYKAILEGLRYIAAGIAKIAYIPVLFNECLKFGIWYADNPWVWMYKGGYCT